MRKSRVLALILTMVMVFGFCSTALAEGVAAPKSVTVIAASDFQAIGGDIPSQANVNSLLTQVKKDHPTADGLIFCGDYDKSLPSKNVAASIGVLKSTVEAALGEVDAVFVQGNHDNVAQGSNGLSGPGAHDTDDYGVFVIDEDDYQWSYNIKEARIKETAANLKAYLDAKVAEGYSKPIFVATHVPLHYTVRTYGDGDGRYASYIVDVLNEAGKNGLNIIFLYGHDHSQGWDNYLGGAAVYLPVGSTMLVAKDGSKTAYKEVTLNFTYMNAGFVGYYADWEPDTDAVNVDSGVDKNITMSVFTITGDTVTVERYDVNGIHNLKSEGHKNVKHVDRETKVNYDITTEVYPSPQTITLNSIKADTVTATCGADAAVAVSYNGVADITSARLSIDSALPIKSIESNYSFEYNPAEGLIVVYDAAGAAIGGKLFTINYDLNVEPWYADGEYPIDIELVQATNGDVDIISARAIDGAIVLDNAYPAGDADLTGKVTNADVIAIARYLVGLVEFTAKQIEAADVDDNGVVNNTDLVKIARTIVAA